MSDVVASVMRDRQRQGRATVIPTLILMEVDEVVFQPDTGLVFIEGQGAALRKRHRVFARWTPELEDAIAANGLARVEPIQAGDTLMIPDIPPGSFAVDDADAYPGHHIEIYTFTVPGSHPA